MTQVSIPQTGWEIPQTDIPSRDEVKYYQVGSFAVGNRLVPDALRSVQSETDRFNSLTSGHRACQGCGEALGARYAVDAAMNAAGRNPEKINDLRTMMILGISFIDALAIIGFIVAIVGKVM